MRVALRAALIGLWLVAGAGALANQTNSTNVTRVGFRVDSMGANATGDSVMDGLAASGWGVDPIKVEERYEMRVANPAGNGTAVNCTATPDAADCQGDSSGLAAWAIALIVVGSVVGAGGVGVLIWWLYTKYGPPGKGYTPVAGADLPKIIFVQLVAPMGPPDMPP